MMPCAAEIISVLHIFKHSDCSVNRDSLLCAILFNLVDSDRISFSVSVPDLNKRNDLETKFIKKIEIAEMRSQFLLVSVRKSHAVQFPSKEHDVTLFHDLAVQLPDGSADKISRILVLRMLPFIDPVKLVVCNDTLAVYDQRSLERDFQREVREHLRVVSDVLSDFSVASAFRSD